MNIHPKRAIPFLDFIATERFHSPKKDYFIA
jgi:hypothetical protein